MRRLFLSGTLLLHCHHHAACFSSAPHHFTASSQRPLHAAHDSANADPPATKPLSKRAARKAAERAKKARANTKKRPSSQHPEALLRSPSRRKHNFSSRPYLTSRDPYALPLSRSYAATHTLVSPASPPPAHELHSTAIPRLDANTTAEEVVRAIKRAQNLHDLHDVAQIAHFLVEMADPSFAYGYRGSLLSRLAVAALHLGNVSIAERCIAERRRHHRASMLPLESAAIVRGFLRCHCIAEAWEVLEDELSLPPPGWDCHVATNEQEERQQLETKERLVHRARSLGSIISRHLYREEPTAALLAMERLKSMSQMVHEAGITSRELDLPWERFVRGAATCESRRREGKWEAAAAEAVEKEVENPDVWPCNLVYSVLNAMIALPSDNNDETFESLCNALVRRTVFVTGAVDMKGCPAPDRGECAFIGRSNVGKSSLVNMLTNRKSLAFTSKTPGKTQQFNYFAVNDKPDLERQIRFGDEVGGHKDRDSFYIVDLPGFGFAKVPQKQRQKWSDFMEEYFEKRENLKVVFHLIDARHGPTEEDGRIMQKVGDTLDSKRTVYVVILTKADKNVKGANLEKNPGKVSNRVWEKLLETMKVNKVGYAPIVLTSANTRLGRDEVWKYLRLAAEV